MITAVSRPASDPERLQQCSDWVRAWGPAVVLRWCWRHHLITAVIAVGLLLLIVGAAHAWADPGTGATSDSGNVLISWMGIKDSDGVPVAKYSLTLNEGGWDDQRRPCSPRSPPSPTRSTCASPPPRWSGTRLWPPASTRAPSAASSATRLVDARGRRVGEGRRLHDGTAAAARPRRASSSRASPGVAGRRSSSAAIRTARSTSCALSTQRLTTPVEHVVLHSHADVEAHRHRDRGHRQLRRAHRADVDAQVLPRDRSSRSRSTRSRRLYGVPRVPPCVGVCSTKLTTYGGSRTPSAEQVRDLLEHRRAVDLELRTHVALGDLVREALDVGAVVGEEHLLAADEEVQQPHVQRAHLGRQADRVEPLLDAAAAGCRRS